MNPARLSFSLMNEILGATNWLGIQWHPMKVVGWLGNLLFFSRFLIQWIASERAKRVVVPIAFWYCSLLGSLLLLAYALYKRDSVFIFAYVFTWIPYGRNLYFAYRDRTKSHPKRAPHPELPPDS
ncbi:lipid-A-disaccharide synthase N-terminal domain-containing protein [Candidatus Methylacidithermus pantelleriae]|nr:lipid-A-disaccharide synthase N-terminal domain-containing protein [Candidatus Methylacidithermus pantelleriae]